MDVRSDPREHMDFVQGCTYIARGQESVACAERQGRKEKSGMNKS